MKERIDFRTKVSLISFVLSVGVVFQHTQWRCNSIAVLSSIHSMFFYILQTCVPFFFMISGYLFFRNFEMGKLKEKWKSRVKTLLIPYIIWNILYAVFMFLLYRLGFVNNISISDSKVGILFQIVNAEYSPLWFVKYLMVFAIISPLTYILLRNKAVGGVVIIVLSFLNALFYYLGVMEIPINVNANNLVMLNYQYIFYAIGSYSAMNFKTFVEVPSRRKSLVATIFVSMLTIMYFWGIYSKGDVIVNHIFRIIFVCGIWFVFDCIQKTRIRGWMKISFFIYCMHLIILQCVQAVSGIIIDKFFKGNQLLYIFDYLLVPILVIVMIIAVAHFLKKYVPVAWKLLTGNRG